MIPSARGGLALLLWLAVPAGVRAQAPSPQAVERAMRSVVQVQARECGGRAVDATGFAWDAAGQVVTALHVVAGCARVSVYSHHAGSTSTARVARVLTDADLALLVLDVPLSIPPLESAAAEPRLQDDLVALGYPLTAPTPTSTSLRVAYGSGRLDDVLPDAARRQVQEAGMPSLALPILRLEGHLVPGLSGAPVIDRDGRVAAVGDGGLEGGAVSISWALPARHVDRLSLSDERLTQRAVAARPLFAAEVDARPAETTTRCGDMAFRRMRTRSYAQLAATTDDPLSEQYLRSLFQVAEVDPTGFRYDIYVNAESGATVAVPEGLQLEEWPWGCTAETADGGLTLHVGGTLGQDIQMASSLFEQNAAGQSLQWVPDPAGSYFGPQQRWDGAMVNRKAFYGARPDDPGWMLGVPSPVAYYFETLAARGGAFLGVAAVHNNYADISAANMMQCMLVMTPSCQRGMEQFDDWAALVMAAFLSTFPIG